jgi:hypothetical protein
LAHVADRYCENVAQPSTTCCAVQSRRLAALLGEAEEGIVGAQVDGVVAIKLTLLDASIDSRVGGASPRVERRRGVLHHCLGGGFDLLKPDRRHRLAGTYATPASARRP